MAGEALAVVVGRNCARLRTVAGLTQEQFAVYARGVGLRWTASKVADFERGRREITFGSALAVSRALSDALSDAVERGAARDVAVTLADLLDGKGAVAISADGPDVPASVVAGVCRGDAWPRPVSPEAVHERVVRAAAAAALVDGRLDPNLTAVQLAEVRRRSGLSEDRVAKRLGVSRDRLAAVSFRLWSGRTFSEERDRRAGVGANQQRKGQVGRVLTAELREGLADGDS